MTVVCNGYDTYTLDRATSHLSHLSHVMVLIHEIELHHNFQRSPQTLYDIVMA